MKPLFSFSLCWIALLPALQSESSVNGWIFPNSRPHKRHFARPTPLSVSPSEFGAFGTGNQDPETNQRPEPLPLRELYPASTARYNGTIAVDSIHTLYLEVHGNGNGNLNEKEGQETNRAALFLHGGPGAGCTPTHARFFDPDLYDTIVLLDQRGCGRSTPRGQVINNTLSHLIGDCETLRKHVLDENGVWHTVLGGSWGSTLAIAYAQQHPFSIKSLVLRGVCLLRPGEVDWLFTPQGGAAQKNPEAWKAFAGNVGKEQTNNEDDAAIDRSVLHEYYDRMFGTNTTKRWMAARGWMTWEFTVSSSFKKNLSQDQAENSPAVLVSYSYPGGLAFQDRYGRVLEQEETEALALDTVDVSAHKLRQGLPPQSAEPLPADALSPRPTAMSDRDFDTAQTEQFGNFSGLPALPMLTCYYSVNDQSAMNGWDLLDPARMDQIRYLPCIAVQGGRDPICPPDTALDLKQQWPGMELRMPLNAGHSMYHPELIHELVQATDRVGRFVT